MREGRRPGAAGDSEAPQSAGAEAEAEDGAGDAQASARQQRAHKRRAAANDGDADAFNQRHASEVAEFNQLTKHACLGEDGKLDAAAVKEWQREHAVAPDGKVGPKTLTAAGGRADEAKDTDAAKIDQPKADNAEKKKGPVEDILDWLGLADIRHAIEQLKMLALAPGGADKEQGREEAKPSPAEAKPEDAGLNSRLSIDAFGNAVEALKPRWGDLDPGARGDDLIALANEQPAAAGVFPVNGFLDPSVTGRIAGKFNNEHWKVRLNKQLFSKTKFKPDDAPHMAATVYHEARHAEQYFRMAQLLAGRNATADDIVKQLHVPSEVAASAIQTKILPDDPAAKFAEKMFDDRAGKGAKHNVHALEHIQEEMRVYEPLFAKYEAAKASKDPKAIEEAHAALLAVKKPVMHAWNEYINRCVQGRARRRREAWRQAGVAIALLAGVFIAPRHAAADLSDETASVRSKPAVIETIEAYCKLVSESADVIAAAQRYGMHIVDDKLSVSFTPRDRSFSHGIAVRRFRTNELSGIELDVEPTIKLPFAKLRDSFGPFHFVQRFHPDDDYEFSGRWTPPGSKVGCTIIATLRAHTDRPSGHEVVSRVSIGR